MDHGLCLLGLCSFNIPMINDQKHNVVSDVAFCSISMTMLLKAASGVRIRILQPRSLEKKKKKKPKKLASCLVVITDDARQLFSFIFYIQMTQDVEFTMTPLQHSALSRILRRN